MAPDEPGCRIPEGFSLQTKTPTSATFTWSPKRCSCDTLQLQLVATDTLGLTDTLTRDIHGDTTVTVHNLDTAVRYSAQLRSRCHHQCPSHDAWVWGRWTAPLRFHLGVSEPVIGIDRVAETTDGLALRPNPATGSVTVTLAEGVALPVEVEVVDLSGRTVLARRATSPTLTLPLDGLPAGTYLVRAAGHTRRLVKN